MITIDQIKAIEAAIRQMRVSVESGSKAISDGRINLNQYNAIKKEDTGNGWFAHKLTGESTISIQIEISLKNKQSGE